MTNQAQLSIPANVEAEQAVLGAMLIDPSAYYKVAQLLRPADFYRERNGWLYSAIGYLAELRKPLDTVTICDELERRGQLDEIGGPAFVVDMINATPTAIYVEYYAEIVARAATQRRLITAAGEIAKIGYDSDRDTEDAIEAAEGLIFAVNQGRNQRDMISLSESLRTTIENISLAASNPNHGVGLTTGFTILDRMLGGLQKSDLIILAARPGMGKSALALSIAQACAKRQNARVAIFSMEMSREQMTQRLLSMESAIDSHRLRLGAVEEDEWPILMEAANSLNGLHIHIDDTPGASVSDVRAKCRRLYAEHGLDMIIIDYMQLMTGPGGGKGNDNRQQEISFISRSLKALARELNVPVIALSQLSRAVESRADKKPMLSDLRESGSIEQDADLVLFIYREDYYIEDSDKQNIADILIAKHRHGSTGTVNLYFRKELTQFRDLEIQREELNY